MTLDVWFDAVDTCGEHVSLRVPTPDQLDVLVGGWADDESNAAFDDTDEIDTSGPAGTAVAEVVDGTTILEEPAMIAPVWWIEAPGCDGEPDGGGDCRCGIVSFSEALRHLDPAQRATAVNAHLAAMSALALHLDAARELADGAMTLGDVCVHCLLGGDDHTVALEDELLGMSSDLAEAFAIYPMAVTVGERHDPSGTTGH